jgi:hypothetical protein
VPATTQRSDFSRAVLWRNLGPNVIDIEGTTDRLARLPSLTGEKNRLDASIVQSLDGSSRTGAQAVLQR